MGAFGTGTRQLRYQ